MEKITLLVAACLALTACTDAERSAFTAYGSEATVTCYSGGEAVYEATSTGKVLSSESGAGVYFRDGDTGLYVRAYADCIVVEKP